MIEIENQNRENILSDLIPDLTPLIDVMFMLMVFLILTINQAEKIFTIAAPSDQENISILSEDYNKIKITIFANNNDWGLNTEKFNNFTKFIEKLQKTTINNANHQLIIYCDKNANVEKLLRLMTYLKKNKLENINLIME